MKNAIFISFVLVFLASCSSVAVKPDPLNPLFEALKNAPNELEAQKIENQIWLTWLESGDEKVDELIRSGMRKRINYDFDGAIEDFNKVIELKPDYPEVWNQRAVAHFYKQDYENSLIDVAKALELEPRHFGAMAGRAVIRLYQTKPALARQNIIEALKIHPYLQERRLFPDL